MRHDVLKQKRIFIPDGARICLTHRETADWTNAAVHSDFSKNQIQDMVDLLRRRIPTSVETIQPHRDIKCDTGLSDVQFNDVFSLVPSLIRDEFKNNTKSARTALYMFLMRLRKGFTYEDIGMNFGVSRTTASKNINKARNALKREFIPLHLGFENLSREFLIDNSTRAARLLYNDGDSDKVITIWDATYIFCNKSRNYGFQKLTYNSQKKRNYVKPMMCVTTNGKMVDVIGPFKATQNDATIMKKLFEKERGIMNILQPTDIMLVDRGFRDCVNFLTAKEYVVMMPSCVTKNESNQPLSTEQANYSRLVTKGRYVVEARNGNMKTIWAVFAKTWSSFSLPHLIDDLRIGAALINRFNNVIVADKDDEEFISNQIMQKLNEPNILLSTIRNATFQARVKEFTEIDETDFNFPELSQLELKKIALGTYQIKQARSYIVKHIQLNPNRKFLSFACPPDAIRSHFGKIINEKNVSQPVFTLTRMSSRFVANKIHRMYVLADADKNGSESIIAYFCECKHGKRTVGCCSHVMTFLMYFGFSRHHGGVKPVAEHLDEFFIRQSQKMTVNLWYR